MSVPVMKEIIHPHVPNLYEFQDILKNVGNQKLLVPIDF